MKRNKLSLFSIPYVVWMAIFVVIPILMVVVYAFSSAGGGFTLDNFARIWDYAVVFTRSFKLALIATVICLLVGYPISCFLAREGAGFQRVAMMLMVLGMVYNFLPFMILPIYSVIVKLDHRLIEAARDLGADSVTVFRRVTLPLSLPGVLSGITMVFVPAVSTFAISHLLGGGKHLLLGNLIEMQFKGSAYNPYLGSAVALVMMVIVVICMSVMNRFGEGEEQAVML